MRGAKGSTHRVIDESPARRRDLRHDVEGRADHERRNTLGFDDVSDETDGLVAKRSIRNEQRQIHVESF